MLKGLSTFFRDTLALKRYCVLGRSNLPLPRITAGGDDSLHINRISVTVTCLCHLPISLAQEMAFNIYTYKNPLPGYRSPQYQFSSNFLSRTFTEFFILFICLLYRNDKSLQIFLLHIVLYQIHIQYRRKTVPYKHQKSWLIFILYHINSRIQV